MCKNIFLGMLHTNRYFYATKEICIFSLPHLNFSYNHTELFLVECIVCIAFVVWIEIIDYSNVINHPKWVN